MSDYLARTELYVSPGLKAGSGLKLGQGAAGHRLRLYLPALKPGVD